MHGPIEEVTTAYLQDVLGIHGKREWTVMPPEATADTNSMEEESSPNTNGRGEAPVRIVSVEIIDANGNTISSVRVDEQVGVKIVYDVLSSSQRVQPALWFKTTHGQTAFVAAYTDPEYLNAPPTTGRFAATAWVPKNLLNTGLVSVSVNLVTPDPLIRHVAVEDAITFFVREGAEPANTARGLYGREFPGAVRPLLKWETLRLTPAVAESRTPAPTSEIQ